MNRNIFFDKVTILGVGLIGASFALALKKHKLCGRVTGFGRSEKNLIRARDREIIDSFSLDPSEASAFSDLILFSMPVGSFTGTAAEIKGSLKEGAIVTDVGSVKGKLVYEIEDILSGRAPFVGAHPIAGSERSGIDIANAELFDRRWCIVTPTGRTDPSHLDIIVSLWRYLGAEVVRMDPQEHDRVFGTVSHLPHIVAYEMMNTAAEIGRSYLGYAGQGFMDSTRIASSSPELWRDICVYNGENLIRYIDAFIGRLEKVKGYIAKGDADSLEKEFKKAKSLRDGLGEN